jgi:hypothetical protein
MSPTALALLQAAAAVVLAVVVQAYAARHVPQEAVPPALRERVEFCCRLRPWLVALAAALVMTALLVR